MNPTIFIAQRGGTVTVNSKKNIALFVTFLASYSPFLLSVNLGSCFHFFAPTKIANFDGGEPQVYQFSPYRATLIKYSYVIITLVLVGVVFYFGLIISEALVLVYFDLTSYVRVQNTKRIREI